MHFQLVGPNRHRRSLACECHVGLLRSGTSGQPHGSPAALERLGQSDAGGLVEVGRTEASAIFEMRPMSVSPGRYFVEVSPK